MALRDKVGSVRGPIRRLILKAIKLVPREKQTGSSSGEFRNRLSIMVLRRAFLPRISVKSNESFLSFLYFFRANDSTSTSASDFTFLSAIVGRSTRLTTGYLRAIGLIRFDYGSHFTIGIFYVFLSTILSRWMEASRMFVIE